MGTSTRRQRVERGGAWFDRNTNGSWIYRIDLSRLDVADAIDCPIAQVFDVDYHEFRRREGVPQGLMAELGFDTETPWDESSPAAYDDLTREWRWYVIERRHAAHDNGAHRKDRRHATASGA